MNNLENIGILVTRPEPQGKILCEKIHALGGLTVYLPTIEFGQLDPPKDALNNLDRYDWIIFISPRAVEYGAHLIQELPKKTRLAAPGEGTALALQTALAREVVYPRETWTSEGLLDLPFFKNPDKQKILLVQGEGGRELLVETLTVRGAIVDQLFVYRRIVPRHTNIQDALKILREKKINIIVCTSGESLHNLMTILGAENQSLLVKSFLIVVSPRLVTLAKELHFQQVFLAENASHSAIIDTLRIIKGKGYVQ